MTAKDYDEYGKERRTFRVNISETNSPPSPEKKNYKINNATYIYHIYMNLSGSRFLWMTFQEISRFIWTTVVLVMVTHSHSHKATTARDINFRIGNQAECSSSSYSKPVYTYVYHSKRIYCVYSMHSANMVFQPKNLPLPYVHHFHNFRDDWINVYACVPVQWCCMWGCMAENPNI